MKSILLYGATGWIGSKLHAIFKDRNFEVIIATSRLNKIEDIKEEIKNTTFDYCVLSAGITRDPKNLNSNIDYCESNITETIDINVLGCLEVVKQCYLKSKSVIYLGTGCIYEYDETHKIPDSSWDGLDQGFYESDLPNFEKSVYSFSKVRFEEQIQQYNNVLVLRIRMPIDYSFHPRNFISKIIKYEKVVNIPNSMSILEDLLPLIPDMLEIRGKINFVNPGVISHNEILDLYKEYVNKDFVYSNFTLEEQSRVIRAPRSNNALNTNKLQAIFPDMPHVQVSIKKVMIELAKLKQQN